MLGNFNDLWMMQNICTFATNGLKSTAERANDTLSMLDTRLSSLDGTAEELSNVMADLADLLETLPDALIQNDGGGPFHNPQDTVPNIKELLTGALINQISNGLANDSHRDDSGNDGPPDAWDGSTQGSGRSLRQETSE